MDDLLQEYGEYSQLIVLAVIVIVGVLGYGGYTYYMKQQNIQNVNNNLKNNSKQPQSMNEGKQPVQGKQQEQGKQPILAFIPSGEFKGERRGYKYGKGPKGLGYYLDKK
jgi:hypothetical protein